MQIWQPKILSVSVYKSMAILWHKNGNSLERWKIQTSSIIWMASKPHSKHHWNCIIVYTVHGVGRRRFLFCFIHDEKWSKDTFLPYAIICANRHFPGSSNVKSKFNARYNNRTHSLLWSKGNGWKIAIAWMVRCMPCVNSCVNNARAMFA